MRQRLIPKRGGTTVTEVIVAATLLLGMIGLVVPTTIRAGKIWKDTRHYQLAINELSNQFEYLSSLNAAERAAALASIEVSEQARAGLPDARLEASLAEDSDGQRLTLSLNWDRGGVAKPLKMVGWLSSMAHDSAAVLPKANSNKEPAHEAT
jgi:hypothetical protein